MKQRTTYVCTSCGAVFPKWTGRCSECSEWNTVKEQVQAVNAAAGKISSFSNTGNTLSFSYSGAVPDIFPLSQTEAYASEVRYFTGTKELDRVLGGGLVTGSLVLVSGEPGIGKSTLLLQICGNMAETKKVLYVSGEESTRQIRLRANRLGISSIKEKLSVDQGGGFLLCSTTEIDAVIAACLSPDSQNKPDMLIIDSIQTMQKFGVNSAPSSITQVRECANALLKLAKSAEISIFIVGHVNKDGGIAGPKALEHIVDTVLYFEGERKSSYRILRAEKNRFGSTNEIGVFEMTDKGLREVPNPSEALLSGRPAGVPGITVFPAVEGSRCLLTEVQALVTKNPYGSQPRRVSDGFDYNRMCLLIAVLEKRTGFLFSQCDVYLNIVGGLKISEPGADLAVAAALYSGLCDRAIPEHTAVFGEIGLGGEIRDVSRACSRIEEAARMGFKRIIVPETSLKSSEFRGIEAVGAGRIGEAFRKL